MDYTLEKGTHILKIGNGCILKDMSTSPKFILEGTNFLTIETYKNDFALKNISAKQGEIYDTKIHYKNIIDFVENNRTSEIIEKLKNSISDIKNFEVPNTSFINENWGDYHSTIIYCVLIALGLVFFTFLAIKYRETIFMTICKNVKNSRYIVKFQKYGSVTTSKIEIVEPSCPADNLPGYSQSDDIAKATYY